MDRLELGVRNGGLDEYRKVVSGHELDEVFHRYRNQLMVWRDE